MTAGKKVDTAVLASLDQTVLALVDRMASGAISGASTSVQKILDVSASFLAKDLHEALSSFRDLYFGQARTAAQRVNDDVDRLIEEAQSALGRGESVEQAVASADVGEGERLGLSALQKKLETVIATQESLREKLVPILSGMQFEDAMTQRVSHLKAAWQWAAAAQDDPKADLEALARRIATTLSSDAEREQFYRLVLREPPPPGVGDTGIWLDLSA